MEGCEVTSRKNSDMSRSVTNATAPSNMCIKQAITTHQHRHSSSVGNDDETRDVNKSNYNFSDANPGLQLLPLLLNEEESNFTVHRRSLGTVRLRRRFRQRGIDKVCLMDVGGCIPFKI